MNPPFSESRRALPRQPWLRVAGAALGLGWLCASAAVLAAGPAGPVGPVGPIGPVGRDLPTDARAQNAPKAPPQRTAPPRPASGAHRADRSSAGNHIEVTGNTASGTRCGAPGSASVNSVDVSGARLEGRTVIVQGRNAENVRSSDCPPPGEAPRPQHSGSAATHTNSIHIR